MFLKLNFTSKYIWGRIPGAFPQESHCVLICMFIFGFMGWIDDMVHASYIVVMQFIFWFMQVILWSMQVIFRFMQVNWRGITISWTHPLSNKGAVRKMLHNFQSDKKLRLLAFGLWQNIPKLAEHQRIGEQIELKINQKVKWKFTFNSLLLFSVREIYLHEKFYGSGNQLPYSNNLAGGGHHSLCRTG